MLFVATVVFLVKCKSGNTAFLHLRHLLPRVPHSQPWNTCSATAQQNQPRQTQYFILSTSHPWGSGAVIFAGNTRQAGAPSTICTYASTICPPHQHQPDSCTKTFPCCKRLQQPLLERLTPAECAESAQAICQGTASCNALQTPPSQCRSGSTPASVRHASVTAEQSLTHERSNPTTKQPIRKAVSSRLSDSHQTVMQAA
jgi:hypothetical protein